MGDETVKIVIEGKDEATGAFKEVEKGLEGIREEAGRVEETKEGIGALPVMLGNLGAKLAEMGIVMVLEGVRLGFEGLGLAIRTAVGEAMVQEEELAQLQAVLESTGGAAGVTAEMAVGLADSLAETTRFSDDTILSGENLLLTFTRVGKDAFPVAMQAGLDMATALDMDLRSALMQVGKALNDPIDGMTALKRSGVTFTDEQTKMITALWESGDALGAQTIILGELQREFGGSAEAAGTTFAGQLEILRNSLLNVAEGVGMALLPTLTDLAGQLIKFVQSDQFQVWVKQATDWLLVKLPEAIKTTATFWREELKPALDEVWPVLRDDLIPLLTTVGKLLGPIMIPIMELFIKGWGLQVRAFEFAISPITNVVNGVKNLQGVFAETYEKLKNLDWFAVGKALVDGIINGIRRTAARLINATSELGASLLGMFNSMFNIHSPSGVMEEVGWNLGMGLEEGLRRSMGLATLNATAYVTPMVGAMGPAGTGGGGWGRSVSVTVQAGAVLSFANEAELEAVLRPLVLEWVR